MICLKPSQASATGWIADHVQLNLTQLTNILELGTVSWLQPDFPVTT